MTVGAWRADTARKMVLADGKFTSDVARDIHKASEIQVQRLATVSTLITLESEADPHRREQDGVRHCRLQAGKAQSSPHQRGLLRQPARPLVVQVRDSVIHVPHQGGRCWSPFSGVLLSSRSRDPECNQTALALETQSQDLEERQSCRTGPDVASCAREKRVSGSAGAHQYRAALRAGR